MEWQEFHLKKGSRVQVWKIALADNKEEYFTQHGILNGKMQEFSDKPGDKGKFGTEAYVDAEKNTLFHISREIRKKEEHGYVEVDSHGNPVKQQITSIDWDQYLPKNFCPYKPQTSINDKDLEIIHNKGLARYSRKYDGHSHIACYHNFGWEIYSRRMDLSSERFPKHIEQLQKLSFQPGTILVGEMACFNKNKTDNLKNISRITRSLPEESRRLIDSGEIEEPIYLIYDILFLNKESLKDHNYDSRRMCYQNLARPFHRRSDDLICQVETFNVTPKNWANLAKDAGWEGFVLVDGSSVPGDKFYSFDGKAERPKGHHKLKSVHEEDVVVYAAITGTGKLQGKIGALFVKQRWPEGNSNEGEWFSCGKVGSGLLDKKKDTTVETRDELEQILKKNNVPFFEDEKLAEKISLDGPGVPIQIEYGERQPGTQKFKFPVFIRCRLDKSAEECYAQHLSEE